MAVADIKKSSLTAVTQLLLLVFTQNLAQILIPTLQKQKYLQFSLLRVPETEKPPNFTSANIEDGGRPSFKNTSIVITRPPYEILWRMSQVRTNPPPPLIFSWTDLMDVDVVYFSVYLYDSSTDLTSISVPYTILWDLISDCNYQHKRPTHSPVLSLPISRRQAQLSSVWCAKWT